jgi:hypothetical protein
VKALIRGAWASSAVYYECRHRCSLSRIKASIMLSFCHAGRLLCSTLCCVELQRSTYFTKGGI